MVLRIELKTYFKILFFLLLFMSLSRGVKASEDAYVYSVNPQLSLGRDGEVPVRDIYITIGSKQGLKKGDVLEVSRRVATYDLTSEKFYQEVEYPYGQIRVIHADQNVSITRLEKIFDPKDTPSYGPDAVMVGDLVRKR